MTDSMVERVARSLATARWRHDLDEFTDKAKWAEAVDAYDLTNNNGRFEFDQEARAAIEAMREPTDEMTTAAALADHDGYDNDAAGVYSEMWSAMVDAALQDKSTGEKI